MLPIEETLALAARLEYLVGLTSRAVVAELCGVSAETVRRWLNGQEPSLNGVILLCRNLGLPLEWLAFGDAKDSEVHGARKSNANRWLLLGGPAHGLSVASGDKFPPRVALTRNRRARGWSASTKESAFKGPDAEIYEHMIGRAYRWVPSVTR